LFDYIAIDTSISDPDLTREYWQRSKRTIEVRT